MIWSSDVSALSVKALIIIPVVAATLWIIAIVVFFLPLPEILSLTATMSTGPQSSNAGGGKIEKEDEEKPKAKSRTDNLMEIIGGQVDDAVSFYEGK